MDRALIIGSAGQDGRLLSERLEREGCAVVGVERNRVTRAGDAFGSPVDILDPRSIGDLVGSISPDGIFYLAAYHHSAEDKALPDDVELYLRSHDIHVRGLIHVLEAIRKRAPASRLFYAASSHCFGEPPTAIQDENTPLRPRCAYGITKTAGVGLCRMYRANHRVRASAGFFYNHESPCGHGNSSRPRSFAPPWKSHGAAATSSSSAILPPAWTGASLPTMLTQ